MDVSIKTRVSETSAKSGRNIRTASGRKESIKGVRRERLTEDARERARGKGTDVYGISE